MSDFAHTSGAGTRRGVDAWAKSRNDGARSQGHGGDFCPPYLVAFSRNFTSAARSSAEPICCSGILVPGV
jgi:hypothetical protein